MLSKKQEKKEREKIVRSDRGFTLECSKYDVSTYTYIYISAKHLKIHSQNHHSHFISFHSSKQKTLKRQRLIVLKRRTEKALNQLIRDDAEIELSSYGKWAKLLNKNFH